MYHCGVSKTIFADEPQFSVRYDGDFIEAAVFVQRDHADVLDFLYEFDSNWTQARQEAVQCYISLKGDE